MKVNPPGDQEIAEKLKERTTEELIAFREKLKRMGHNNPQAMGIRFHLIKELIVRQLCMTEEENG